MGRLATSLQITEPKRALQRARTAESLSNLRDPVHRFRAPDPVISKASPASVAKQNAMEPCEMSQDFLSSSRDTLRARLARALHRIIRVDKVISVEQLADAQCLNVSRQTVYDWLSGYRDPRGDHLCALIQMFGAGFANEVLGSDNIYVINPQADRRAELLQRMAETQAELMKLEGGHTA